MTRAETAERELEFAAGAADKAEQHLRFEVARADQAEGELRLAVARADKLEGELHLAQSRVQKAEADAHGAAGRAIKAEGEGEQWRTRAIEAEARLALASARGEGLGGELARARSRLEQLEAELRLATTRADHAEHEIELGRARVEELRGEIERGAARVEELESELASRRAQAEEAAAAIAELEQRLDQIASDPDPEPVSAEPQLPPAPIRRPAAPAVELARLDAVGDARRPQATSGVSWQPTAKRTLSASLARESVWRNVLKQTVQVLGSEGGWDTVTAWLPDESDGLGCAATWTAHRGLDRFEALTWEAGVRREGSLLDQALQAPHLTWLTDIDAVDDERLQTAAAHGMSSALLLPVRNGPTTIGLLELLTHDSIEPDAQIALSLEASALQLGRFGHLLSIGK